MHQRLVLPAHLGVSEALRRPLALSTLVATTAGIRRSGRRRRTPSHDPAPRMVRTLRSGAAWNSGAQQGHRRELADPRVRHALGTALQGAVDSGLSDAAIASHTRLGAVLRRSMGRRDEQREAGLAHAAAWKESGLTQAAYAGQHGLAVRSLARWISRSRRPPAARPPELIDSDGDGPTGEAGGPPGYGDLVWATLRPGDMLPAPEIDEAQAEGMLRNVVDRLNALHAARSSLPVLIHGETGTGKERVAQLVHLARHYLEPAAFVVAHVSGLSQDLAGDLLFGHKKGAYTGALEDTDGLLHRAHGGTLYIDEVGDLAPEHQVRLLRALETGECPRIGDPTPRKSQFDLVSATNVDVHRAVRAGRIREDFYWRIAGLHLELPPLRLSRSILLSTATFFWDHIRRNGKLPSSRNLAALAAAELTAEVHAQQHYSERAGDRQELPDGALEALAEHLWPGNLRELRWVMARADLDIRSTPSLLEFPASAFRSEVAEARRRFPPRGRHRPGESLEATPDTPL